LGTGGADTLHNQTKQPGFEDEACKRIRYSHTQRKNNQSVFGVVPGLNRVIPTVEGFKDRTDKAGQQNNHSRYSRRPSPHGFEYSAAGSGYAKPKNDAPGSLVSAATSGSQPSLTSPYPHNQFSQKERRVRAVELSALRQDELIPLVEQLDDLDLRVFEYKAFHAPSLMDREFESVAISALEQVALREWPIIVHQMPCTYLQNGLVLRIFSVSKT
jgi:hypothetical protein